MWDAIVQRNPTEARWVCFFQMVEDDMQMRKSRVKVDLPPHMQTRVPSPPEKYIKSEELFVFSPLRRLHEDD
ncbi:UNVERIFIED_CONTAM: hypothetical protein FKN15_032783 [Acipenser sinensis]